MREWDYLAAADDSIDCYLSGVVGVSPDGEGALVAGMLASVVSWNSDCSRWVHRECRRRSRVRGSVLGGESLVVVMVTSPFLVNKLAVYKLHRY